jgi:hypothetical protein
MRRAGFILSFGLLACIAAFAGFYFVGTASSRELLKQPHPELAWLKKEFKLNDEEFSRIVTLHEGYLPQCAERCKLIEEQNVRLQQMLATADSVTPEIEGVLALRAKIRSDCETEMLRHFLEVSRTMPEAQGRRYLAWVEQQTFLRGSAMEQRHHAEASEPDPHRGHHH